MQTEFYTTDQNETNQKWRKTDLNLKIKTLYKLQYQSYENSKHLNYELVVYFTCIMCTSRDYATFSHLATHSLIYMANTQTFCNF